MHSTGAATGPPDRLASLAAAVDELAAQDLNGLTDAALAEQVLRLRHLLDRLEGRWLQELAAVDARGAAGTERDQPAASTASWLRTDLRLGAGAATSSVRTARALFRGPLAGTARALTDGALSVTHATVLASGPTSFLTTSPSRPNRCWWRRPAASTHRGCGGFSTA